MKKKQEKELFFCETVAFSSDSSPSQKNSNKDLNVPKPKPDYLGHRQRLRERFQNAGITGLSDYELLELLLFRSIPRSDTKKIAKILLKTFGSLAEVLGAPAELIEKVEGVGKATSLDLKIIACAAEHMAKSKIQNREILSSWDKILEYCRIKMAFESNEQFRILFLNKKNHLIADELQQKGTVDYTPIYPREIIRRTLDLSASAIILVHNHPSGDPTPSMVDLEMTKKIISIAQPLGISIYDHLIIGKNDIISMKKLGLIE